VVGAGMPASMRSVEKQRLLWTTKAEQLTNDNMKGIIGTRHNRCSKYCSSHLIGRSKSSLKEGKRSCSSRLEYKTEELNGKEDCAIYGFRG
jgi:hypothetical protein